jgi:nucleoside 2-deoxyribosyltransferase
VFDEQPQAFVALPSRLANSPVAEALTDALKEHGVQISSATTATTEKAIAVSEQIHADLRRADFVVADLTDRNPNVIFELGMAVGLGKPVLLLSQDSAADLPFDLRARQVVVYRPDEIGSIRRYLDLWLRDLLAARRRAVTTS